MEATAVKYWPVIFSTESVKATIKGEKTNMRRVKDMVNKKSPMYQEGDIIWVLEQSAITYGPGKPTEYHYLADKTADERKEFKFSNPENMPKQAARIFLKVKSIYSESYYGTPHWVIEFEKIEKPKGF